MIQLQIGLEKRWVEEGSTALSLIETMPDHDTIYAITVDGKLQDLKYCFTKDATIAFLSATSETGKLIYERTLHFAFIVALKRIYQEADVCLEHALSGGIYGHITNIPPLQQQDITHIIQEMNTMIAHKEEIHRELVSTQEAVSFFQQQGMEDKANLLKTRKSDKSSIYRLCGIPDYFYGIMLPHVGYLTHFSLRLYGEGIWLSAHHTLENQKKLFHVFQEFETWGRLIEVSTIDQLNQAIQNGRMNELILMSEAMIEKKLSVLANRIVKHHPNTKFIMIAGPSSAGKTTFSRRLGIHLKIAGKKPFAISMDDYYKNREDCPKLADGNYDFDSLEALDVAYFHKMMDCLLQHIPVCLPTFNFKTGLREWRTTPTVLEEDQILIIEGIHGLNPKMSASLPPDCMYKIYINALTHLNLDAHNRIPTSDYRLIRRLARDYHSRGWDAQHTISFWKNVRDGEDAYIYPFQEEADTIFNSSMVYELSILKKLVIPLLDDVCLDAKEYLEANRLKKLLEYFEDGEEEAVPCHSIFAEFLGTSIFDVS